MKILSNLDLRQNQLLQAVIEHLAAHPVSPVKGQIYFNTTDDKFYGYTENNQWVDLSNIYDDSAIKETISQIQKQLEGLDGDLGSHTHEAEDVNFKADILTVNGIGGIKPGQNLNGLSVQEVLTKLIYPHVNHEVNGISSSPNGGVYEFGDVQTVTQIKGNVVKKSNPITKVEVYKGSEIYGTKTGDEVKNGGTFTFPVNVEVSQSGVNFGFRAYANGENGSPLEMRGNTGTFTFVYPYYFGKVAADKSVLTEEDIKAMTKKIEVKGNKSHSYTVNNERMVIAYPKSYGVLKTIVDPNGFDNFGAFVRTEINITGLDKTSQAYYVYVNGASTNSNFAMKFNY